MLWSYAILPDETSIAYSATRPDGTVHIVAERPIDFGFDHAECNLPLCDWTDSHGFSQEEMSALTTFLKNNAPLIFDMADERLEEKEIA